MAGRKKKQLFQTVKRTLTMYFVGLFSLALLLALLHFLFSDYSAGGIRWFNLDKERNISTWFSAAIFALFALAAFLTYFIEEQENTTDNPVFRFSMMWIAVGIIGLLMSLDEMTILHENLFWKEVRQVSALLNPAWIYITQWQILFAPAILLILAFFVVFFINRFEISPQSKRLGFFGVGFWIMALVLEGLRGSFKFLGDSVYDFEVVVEELLEMSGAIALLAAISFYAVNIALNLTQAQKKKISKSRSFFSRSAVNALGITLIIFIGAASLILYFGNALADAGAPIPSLVEQALEDSESTIFNLESAIGPDEIWFDDILASPPLDDAQAVELATVLATAIFESGFSTDSLPDFVINDHEPRILFVSLSDGKTPARVIRNSGQGLLQVIGRAVEQANELLEDGFDLRFVKIDFTYEAFPTPDVDPNSPLDFDRSILGIAFDRVSGMVFLPTEVVSHSLIDNDQDIRFDNLQDYFELQSIDNDHLSRLKNALRIDLYRFKTQSFFYNGEKIIELYRGHRMYEAFSSDERLVSALAGGDYLNRSVQEDGRFIYSYLPKSDQESDSYNILRHAGTIYSMMEVYEVIQDDSLLNATTRAIDYLLLSAEPCPIAGSVAWCIVEDDKVKLGGNGLAVVALAKYTQATGDQSYYPEMKALANGILDLQGETGEFVHQIEYSSGEIIDFDSQYYPGEALLALNRIYAIDQDESWIDAAQAGTYYLINVRDFGLTDTDLTHDHWLLYTLNDLYRNRPDDLYLEHTIRIANSIMQSQNFDPDFPDWLGSYYEPPRSTPTATRSEGLCAAYQLVRDFGPPDRAEDLLAALNYGINFQLQTQFTPESAIYLKDPQRALGGFHRSLTNYEIRIDYVQHNISSLLCASQVQP